MIFDAIMIFAYFWLHRSLTKPSNSRLAPETCSKRMNSSNSYINVYCNRIKLFNTCFLLVAVDGKSKPFSTFHMT